VTSAKDDDGASPSSSRTQRPATSPMTDADGATAKPPAFWSHAEAIQSAASAAGSEPPMTKPK
jgi:hypothetical protein